MRVRAHSRAFGALTPRRALLATPTASLPRWCGCARGQNAYNYVNYNFCELATTSTTTTPDKYRFAMRARVFVCKFECRRMHRSGRGRIRRSDTKVFDAHTQRIEYALAYAPYYVASTCQRVCVCFTGVPRCVAVRSFWGRNSRSILFINPGYMRALKSACLKLDLLPLLNRMEGAEAA